MEKINKTDSLRTILSGNRFTVNYYQREFRWGRKQIEQLIDDLTSTFIEFYDAKKHTHPSAVQEYGYYYMGCTIRTGGNTREIIDGQQRLTSLTLLLIYLNNLLKANGQTVGHVASMIYSDNYGVKSFNIDVEDRRECFNRLFNNDVNFEPEKESSRNMLERYKDIDELFPEDLKGDALPLFTYWLMEKVLLLEIEAPTEKEAFTIFVTMNDRGLSLNSAEMLKGFVLQEVDAPYRQDTNTVWQKTITRIKETSESEHNGEVTSEDVDFIAAWLRAKYARTMREATKGAKDEDYEILGDRFHEWVRDNAEHKMGLKTSEDFRNFIDIEMRLMANVYLRIKKYSKTLTTGYEDVFNNGNRDLNYQGMLILSAIDKLDNAEEIDKKIHIVAKFVDIYASKRLFNYKKVNFNTTKYYLFRLMNRIRNANSTDLGIILTHELHSMESTLEGIDSFRLNQFTARYMLHFLARITSHINIDIGNPSEFDRYINRQEKNLFDIEHILPDKYETYAENFNDEEDFINYRARFGNLILLTKDKNRSYQAMPYKEKVQKYLGDNILAQSLNSKAYQNNPGFIPLAKKYGFKPHDTSFGKEEILERQEVYKAIAYDIWDVSAIKALAGGWSEAQEEEITGSRGTVNNSNTDVKFVSGNQYSRNDVYRILNVPPESQRGNWETGYTRFNDEYYIFANIDVPGRTGHNYHNNFSKNRNIRHMDVLCILKFLAVIMASMLYG